MIANTSSSKTQSTFISPLNTISHPPINPLTPGISTFTSFIIFGTVPLLAYFVGLAWDSKDRDNNAVYAASCCLAAFCLFVVGAASAELTKQRDQLLSCGLFTLFNGTVAGTLSFLVGFLAERAFHGGET